MIKQMTMKDYLETLFDPGDYICISESVYSNHCRDVNDVLKAIKNYEFVSLNAIKEGKKRADRNVCKFRNFMIEFEANDTGVPLEEQKKVIEKIGMPYTTQVYSGGKSMHFVISLENPVETREEWDNLSKWLYNIMTKHKIDPSTRNVSRFTRVGGGIRIKKGKQQTIMEIKRRVPNKEFYNWLESQGNRPIAKQKVSTKTAHYVGLFGEKYDKNFRGKLSETTLEFIKTGGRKGQRHYSLFQAACDLRDQRYPIEEAKILLLTKLKELGILRDSKAEKTIYDAYNNYKPNLPRF